MKTKEDAIIISNLMKEIGKLANRETVCVLTNMSEPAGNAVGNTLEIIEVVKCLKGDIPEDVKEIIVTLGSYIIKLTRLLSANTVCKSPKTIPDTTMNNLSFEINLRMHPLNKDSSTIGA